MSVTAIEALERRRTIRQYEPDYEIPKDIMDKIMHAAQLSPTACDFQGQDYIVVTNKEKLAKLEKVVLDCMPEDKMKRYFIGRRERHNVKNVVTCDAPCVVLIVKNERAHKDWIKIDSGIAAMSIVIAAQNYGIESMCLGAVSSEVTHEKCEELFGLQKDSLILGVALGKPRLPLQLHEKVIKSKVIYDK
jgi:nitroreductase